MHVHDLKFTAQPLIFFLVLHRSIRVPLIIRDPRMKDEKKGTTNDAFALNIDLAPTILAAAGLPAPESCAYQGLESVTHYQCVTDLKITLDI